MMDGIQLTIERGVRGTGIYEVYNLPDSQLEHFLLKTVPSEVMLLWSNGNRSLSYPDSQPKSLWNRSMSETL